jgi:progressive ankylosis protein
MNGGKPGVPTTRDLLSFWLPVALSGQLITLSQPVVNAAIGRASDAEVALPAYFLGLHVAVLTQALVLPGINVAAALVRDAASFRTVALVLLGAGAISAALCATIARTAIGDFVFRDLMNQTNPRVVEGARDALFWLAPSSIGVALRGALQGAALAEKSAGRLALATAARLVVVFATTTYAASRHGVRGEVAGALGVVAGVFSEALALAWRARSAAGRESAAARRALDNALSAGAVARFAAPLVVGHLAWTLQRPLINAALGRMPEPEATVAAFGLLHSVTLFVSAPLWAFQTTSIVFGGTREGFRATFRMALVVSGVVAAAIVVLLRSVGADVALSALFHIEGRPLALAAGAAWIVAVDPVFHGLRSVFAGRLVGARLTARSGIASTFKIVGTVLFGFFAVAPDGAIDGAALGMGLYVAGTATDLLAMAIAARGARPRVDA